MELGRIYWAHRIHYGLFIEVLPYDGFDHADGDECPCEPHVKRSAGELPVVLHHIMGCEVDNG